VNRNKNIEDRERLLRELILFFKQKKVSYAEFQDYLEEVYGFKLALAPAKLNIPVSVFDNDYLSPLESIVKYLHENENLRLFEIAKLINRDQRSVGVTYRFARRKMKVKLKIRVSKHTLPVSVIADKKLSVLEGIVYYLKQTYMLSYHDTALILRRNDRTVWTVYQRALKKLKKA